MVAYLLFPLSDFIGMNLYITKGIIKKVGTVFIVSPKESGLMLFPKLLVIMGMVSAFHSVNFKFFYAILKCTSLLFHTTLTVVLIILIPYTAFIGTFFIYLFYLHSTGKYKQPH